MKKIWLPALIVVFGFGLVGFVRGLTHSVERRHARARLIDGVHAGGLPRPVAPGLELRSFSTPADDAAAFDYLADDATRVAEARKDACATPAVREALAQAISVTLVLSDRGGRRLARLELACEGG